MSAAHHCGLNEHTRGCRLDHKVCIQASNFPQVRSHRPAQYRTVLYNVSDELKLSGWTQCVASDPPNVGVGPTQCARRTPEINVIVLVLYEGYD